MKLNDRRNKAYGGSPISISPGINTKINEENTIPEPGFIKVTRQDKIKKTAKLLILLGKEKSSEILKHLPEDQVEDIMKEVAVTAHIDAIESAAILKEFNMLQEEPQRAHGGEDVAKRLLINAFGNDRAQAILKAAIPSKKPFEYLNDVPIQLLKILFKQEPVQTVSLVLPFLLPEIASKIIMSFSKDDQKKIIRRLAKRQKVEHEMIELINKELKEKIDQLAKMDFQEVDGASVLANILKYMPVQDEKRLMEDISKIDKTLSSVIKEKIFTMDTIHHLVDRDLQRFLENWSERDIALLSRAKDPLIKEKLMGNLSVRRRVLVEEESTLMGLVRQSEVDEITGQFLKSLKEKEDDGEITILREHDIFF